MNKLLFVFFLILQTGNSYCQNKYTVVYKTVYNKRINLVVHDSVAYCNYLSTGRSDKNIAIDTPLGKKFDGKASYYDAKRFIAIYPIRSDTNPERFVLIEIDCEKVDWEITEKKKNILGRSCTKAIGLIRGDRYVAWFCSELPKVGFGPFTITNLPGLILEYSNKTKGYTSVAIKISNEALPISEPNYAEKIKK